MARPDAIKTEALNRVASFATERAEAKRGSIVGFARRHGWEVTEHPSDNFDALHNITLSKDDKTVRLSVWPGFRRGIALAEVNGVPLSQRYGFPVQERVEMYLAGVPCSCVADPELLHYEQLINPTCEVHGA